jgi:hypothetical protein
LTRALTIIENARMEWNGARLKFAVLSGPAAAQPAPAQAKNELESLGEKNFLQLCMLGIALTWPLALAALAIFVALLLRHR